MTGARERVLAHLETARPFISLNAGLTALAGAAVQHRGLPPLGTAAVIVGVPLAGYLGALYGTDFADREADRRTRPQRPIPSGRIGEDEAVILMLACCGLGFLGASWLGFPAVVAACAAMLVGLLRAKTKDMGLVAPVTRSLGTACNLLFGAAAFGWPLSTATWLVALVFFVDTLPKSLVGGLWDVAADQATGVRTVWVRHGVRRSRWLVIGATAAAFVAGAALPFVTPARIADYWACYAVAAALMALACWQLLPAAVDSGRALSALDWLLRERTALAAAVLAGAAGVAPALAVALPVVVLAEWSRAVVMRPRMYRLQLS
ncbi:MAG TPA: UbiA family prenyltransferase [Candidatus Dormibacteraeota bacterium]|nr:UbiA family prenyltransferase [Candidatus Dormibacteraeota bacterium]